MDVRTADDDDGPGIRETAYRSFRASYSLSPEQIETLVESAFSDDVHADRVADADVTVFVAEVDDTPEGVDVAGFVVIDDEATLRWLHVHPEVRGRGAATALVEAVQRDLDDRSVPFTARLLEAAREGDQFLERFGLDRTDSTTLELGAEEFDEQVYTAAGVDQDANEPAVTVPESVHDDGEERPVARDEEVPGARAPFFPTYEGDDREQRVGFFCSQCGSTAVSADSLDRLECSECGNCHRTDDWDAAYL